LQLADLIDVERLPSCDSPLALSPIIWKPSSLSMLPRIPQSWDSTTRRKTLLAASLLLAGSVARHGSGPIGIFGIVEKVVFEPNKSAVRRSCRCEEIDAVKLDWADLERVVGTGQIHPRIRCAADEHQSDLAVGASGARAVVKLPETDNHAAIVKKLRASLKR